MALAYPDPPLQDGVVALRPWQDDDLVLLERASRDDYVALIERMPVPFDVRAGREWLEERRAQVERERGWALAIADAATGRLALLDRPGVPRVQQLLQVALAFGARGL